MKLYITNTPSGTAFSSSPSYIQIGQGVGGYAGAIGGGLQQNVGGFTTLYSVNAGTYTEVLRCCWNGSTLNTSLNMGSNTLTCGPVNASTGTFSGAVSCGDTLTCGTNALSMTDGTGAFSVTPTMMRALYSYYTSLGPVSLTSGSLTNMPLGSNTQHTTGSGVYYPVLSVNLATGSYNIDMKLILTYNFSGNYTLSNMKVAISTSSTTNDSYYGYTSLPVSGTVTSTANYFFPYQISRQFKFTTTTMVYLLVAPTWTGTANALAYDATCAFSIMRIA